MNLKGSRYNKEDFLVESSISASHVLHVGCTNSPNTKNRWDSGTLLHKRLCIENENSSDKIVGVDIDAEAIDWLGNKLPRERILFGDAHHLDKVFPDEKFDLIIAGDVIEHLSNPGFFLEACGKVLANDGSLIITTVNSFGITRFFKAFLGHEAVHDEHTAYFSPSTISRLAKLSGFSANKISYYSMEKITLSQGLNGILTFLIDKSFGSMMPWFSEGLIVELNAERSS